MTGVYSCLRVTSIDNNVKAWRRYMLKIIDLRIDDRIKPMGVNAHPYVSWRYESDEQSVIQTSYAITVIEKYGRNVAWMSGKVSSNKQAFILIDECLASMTEYVASVIATDNHGNTASNSIEFETALYPEEIQGKWVESSIERKPMSAYKFGTAASPVIFTRNFTLPPSVTRARLYATAFGVYEAKLNGVKADDCFFAPEFTAAAHLMYYQTYDVTELLKVGENTLTLYVADGWCLSAQARPVGTEERQNHSVLYELHVWIGACEIIIASDGTESVSTGTILYSDLYQGESEDQTLPFGEEKSVLVKDYSRSILQPQPMDGVKILCEFPAIELITTPKGEKVIDFGQVITGFARVHVHAPRGTKLTFDYFEILDDEGNYINTMFAPQHDMFVTDGRDQLYEVRFTFHGFRYIRVVGLNEIDISDFTALALTTEKENLSSFETSNPLINRLYQNIRWSQNNNMLSVPMDCPTREKAGWTGDIHVYADTALANENVTPFLKGWLMNVLADENGSGIIKIVSPYMMLYLEMFLEQAKVNGREQGNNVAGWSDAVVFVPWSMYMSTGNTDILKMCYEAIKRFCSNIIADAGKEHIRRQGFHFGEWLIPSEPIGGFEYCKKSAAYTTPFFDCESLKTAAKIAGILGENADAECFHSEYVKMRNAVQKELIVPMALPHLMGAYALALVFDLVPDKLKVDYKKKLLEILDENDGRLDTGFLATPYILKTLSEIGETKRARDMLFEERRPSWLYEVTHGATTIWEAWDADEAGHTQRYVSFDHYALGCVDDYLRECICGISNSTPDWGHIVIAPELDERIKAFKRTLKTVHGTLCVEYEKKEKGMLSVVIPPNSTATVIFGGKTENIGSGNYRF